MVAFGRVDRTSSGYSHAVAAARAHGFDAVERLAGGRAAVFHEATLSFSWASPTESPRSGVEERFLAVASLVVEALTEIGVDARVGEVPGEYCPGKWSVNVAGKTKVMGAGQRLIRGASHVGGVLVVDLGERIRDVLIPVNRALGIDWDPRTAGSIADRSPGLDNRVVAAAVTRALERRFHLERFDLPATILDDARSLTDEHIPKVA
jgi:lipoate-protein ligase A